MIPNWNRPWREHVKSLFSPLGIILISFWLLALIVFAVLYFGYLQPRLAANAPERVYVLPTPPEQRTTMPDIGRAFQTIPPIIDENGVSADSNGLESLERDKLEVDPSEVETSTSAPSMTERQEITTEHGSTPNGQNEALIAEMERANAETERLMREAEAIQNQAMETMNTVIPTIVNHLNTLSGEEQTDFFDQVKSQLDRTMSQIVSQLSPQMQGDFERFYDQHPELANQGYELFLKKLKENGFQDLR